VEEPGIPQQRYLFITLVNYWQLARIPLNLEVDLGISAFGIYLFLWFYNNCKQLSVFYFTGFLPSTLLPEIISPFTENRA